MFRVQWKAFGVTAGNNAGLLDSLLDAVMTALAQTLQILRIEEEHFTTSMRRDVINNGRRDGSALLGAEDAERFCLKLGDA